MNARLSAALENTPPDPRPMIYRATSRDIWSVPGRDSQGGRGPSHEHSVGRTPHPRRAPVEDVGVDHRGADVPVALQVLDGADVEAVLQQVGGERMPEGMARGGLGNPGAANRLLHRPLKDRFVEVVPAPLTGHAVHIE